jgi:hypothetical protein
MRAKALRNGLTCRSDAEFSLLHTIVDSRFESVIVLLNLEDISAVMMVSRVLRKACEKSQVATKRWRRAVKRLDSLNTTNVCRFCDCRMDGEQCKNCEEDCGSDDDDQYDNGLPGDPRLDPNFTDKSAHAQFNLLFQFQHECVSTVLSCFDLGGYALIMPSGITRSEMISLARNVGTPTTELWRRKNHQLGVTAPRRFHLLHVSRAVVKLRIADKHLLRLRPWHVCTDMSVTYARDQHPRIGQERPFSTRAHARAPQGTLQCSPRFHTL